MNKYIPFLKLKSNEIMAIKELSHQIKDELIPFFDFPRKDNSMTEIDFIKTAQSMKKKISSHLQDISSFYLDNYDIDTRLLVQGNTSYKYLLENFSIIPVVGIDRSEAHITAVINAKNSSIIESKNLAIRFTYEDFESFNLVKDDIQDFLEDVIGLFETIDLIFDCRYAPDLNQQTTSQNIVAFTNQFKKNYNVGKVIVTGTSISVPIGDTVNTESEEIISRTELAIIYQTKKILEDIYTGDYTIVGANYSDANIPGNIMMNIMTPKTVYSYDHNHFIIRGGALRTHPDGNTQFNTQAAEIISRPFYRGAKYSFGDNFIEEKSRGIGSNVMPGTILKPTINAHITYMIVDYIC